MLHVVNRFTQVAVALGSLLITGVIAAVPIAAKPHENSAKHQPVSFAKTIRTILSENCYKCHGPDSKTRAAGLRLDTFAGATSILSSGRQAIIPHDQVASTAIERMLLPASDPRHMPPATTQRRIKPSQLQDIRRWVDEGAKYEDHWAFTPVIRPVLPKMSGNPVDYFINKGLANQQLIPVGMANKTTLLRRVTLDLTGLPPSSDDIDAFLADKKSGAYERVVENLLARPAYGERMALMWLDLARYADTHGYHIDSHRDMFRWRDWVIRAFNTNMPYDRFLTEQLAGDLLPNATTDQLVATGFNRNHPINFEGGAIPEEYQTAYVADRVDTTATVTMGLTLRCAQCHDHKYDPIAMQEYYKFFALFNNIDEEGLDGMRGNAKPFIAATSPTEKAQLDALSSRVDGLTRECKALSASILSGQGNVYRGPLVKDEYRWVLGDRPLSVGTKSKDGQPGSMTTATDGPERMPAMRVGTGTAPTITTVPSLTLSKPFSISFWYWSDNGAGIPLSQMDVGNNLKGWDFYLEGSSPLLHFINSWPTNALRFRSTFKAPMREWVHTVITNDGSGKPDGITLFINGQKVTITADHNTFSGPFTVDMPIHIGDRGAGATFQGMVSDLCIRASTSTEADISVLRSSALSYITAVASVANASSDLQFSVAGALAGDTVDAFRNRKNIIEQRQMLASSVPTSMVMKERTDTRKTFILDRGQYDKPTVAVTPGVPSFGKASRLPEIKSRLGLARWLTSGDHPLTSRVAVNRLWQIAFGTGIVRTSENFGVQGEWPSHSELLDWLASEYVRRGWNTKSLLRTLVTSDAYKRSASPSKNLKQRDPENVWHAYASRPRLQAEFVRDMALAASGLLITDIGGPSVKTYQPDGLWEELSFKGDFTAQYYVQDHGEKLYRRSMYTFWKRTVPPPSLQTFDAPEREFCIVRRPATNTPLQALVLLNDPTYTEASRMLAERILSSHPTDAARLDSVFIRLLSRRTSQLETKRFTELLEKQRKHFMRNKKAAGDLVVVGEHRRMTDLPASEVAAWTVVILSVMNLDEAITRP
jgi:hypothetical protein